MNKIISLSGFGWSGGTAVRDLLREYKNINFYPHEYSLIYDPYGFHDLYNATVENWNFLRVDHYIKKHIQYFNHISKKKNKYYHYSKNLDSFFLVNSSAIHKEFIDDLVRFKYSLNSRVNYVYLNPINKIFSRIKNKVYKQSDYSNFSKLSKDEFNKIVNKFHKNLFQNKVDFNTSLLLEKSIPSNNLLPSMNFISNLKVILVNRDPRDTFVQMSNGKSVFWGNNNNITDADVLKFIEWKKAMYSDVEKYQLKINSVNKIEGKEILYIEFESLILDHIKIKSKIESFLNFNSNDQILKAKFLNINRSKQNIGVWRNYKNQSHIDLITKAFNLEVVQK